MAVLNIDDDMARANPRAVIVRTEIRSMPAYLGQLYHDLRRGPQPGYVDQERTHLNTVIVPYLRGPQLRDICAKRRAQRDTRRKLKKNAGVAVIGLIGFGNEAQVLFKALPPRRQLAAYRRIARAIAARAGTTLEGLVVHADETAPHAHFVLAGYNIDGEPLSGHLKKGMLSDFQSIAAEEIQRFEKGIERGRRRWERLQAGATYAETANKSVRQLHAELPADLAAAKERRDSAIADAEAAEQRRDQAITQADGEEVMLELRRREVSAVEARMGVLKAEADAAEKRHVAAAAAADEAERREGELKGEVARLEGQIGESREKLEKNARLIAKAKADLEKHQADAGKVVAIAKRLKSYEKRRDDALEAERAALARKGGVERQLECVAAGARSLIAQAAGGALKRDVWGGIQLKDPEPLKTHTRELMPLADALVEMSERKADQDDREKDVAARERAMVTATMALSAREERVDSMWERLTGFYSTVRKAVAWVGETMGLSLPERVADALDEIGAEIEAREGPEGGLSM